MSIDLKYNVNNHLSRLSRDFFIPYRDNIIGWYRINEGEGNVVHNYSINSKRLPDLTIVGSFISFWTQGSFGISRPTNRNYLHYRSDTPFVTLSGRNKPRCMFVKITDYPFVLTGKQCSFLDINNNEEYSQTFPVDGVSLYASEMLHGTLDQQSGLSQFTNKINVNERWIFLFNVIDTMVRPKIVLDDGTLIEDNAFGLISVGSPRPIKKVNIFGYPKPDPPATYFDGVIADVIWWDDVYLNQEDFKSVYNSLRGRFDMNRPSGW